MPDCRDHIKSPSPGGHSRSFRPLSAHTLVIIFWSDVFPFIISFTPTATSGAAAGILSVSLLALVLLLRAGAHGHAFEPKLLGDRLGCRVVACLGGAVLLLLFLLRLFSALALAFLFLLVCAVVAAGGG